jgi:hypothetical protein
MFDPRIGVIGWRADIRGRRGRKITEEGTPTNAFPPPQRHITGSMRAGQRVVLRREELGPDFLWREDSPQNR